MEFVAFVIALALLEFAAFGMLVGWARGKYRVAAPAIGGQPVFERYFRAHQNTMEQLVAFVPAAQPWQKAQVTEAAHRAHMVELAIAREPHWVLDMHEIERGGPTYTVDTLRALRAGPWPDASLVLVMADPWGPCTRPNPTYAVTRSAPAGFTAGAADSCLVVPKRITWLAGGSCAGAA